MCTRRCKGSTGSWTPSTTCGQSESLWTPRQTAIQSCGRCGPFVQHTRADATHCMTLSTDEGNCLPVFGLLSQHSSISQTGRAYKGAVIGCLCLHEALQALQDALACLLVQRWSTTGLVAWCGAVSAQPNRQQRQHAMLWLQLAGVHCRNSWLPKV